MSWGCLRRKHLGRWGNVWNSCLGRKVLNVSLEEIIEGKYSLVYAHPEAFLSTTMGTHAPCMHCKEVVVVVGIFEMLPLTSVIGVNGKIVIAIKSFNVAFDKAKEVLIQETPRSRGDPRTYGGSNQRSLDCEASVLPLDHGSATALDVVVVFLFYRVHRDCLPYGHRPQKDVLETPRSRAGDRTSDLWITTDPLHWHWTSD
ncbi:hypothetical protein DPMN_014558 [Dreissena polymorpha]|uniref:Uncharacterized protein n=1 Tax=Dreissena polymorpha TaxID=45954 RepID=A0A9D4S5C2_DREPO|nr:hypothetical protein DPMN_014558 [Dreissena polymorpha]